MSNSLLPQRLDVQNFHHWNLNFFQIAFRIGAGFTCGVLSVVGFVVIVTKLLDIAGIKL